MTATKRIQARREKTRALAEREAAARCAYGSCRLPLPKMFIAAGMRFCDARCQEAEWAWQEAKEAKRGA
jgi:hypothetical protein